MQYLLAFFIAGHIDKDRQLSISGRIPIMHKTSHWILLLTGCWRMDAYGVHSLFLPERRRKEE